VRRFSRKNQSLDISQIYRPPNPVTGTALLLSFTKFVRRLRMERVSLPTASQFIAETHTDEKSAFPYMASKAVQYTRIQVF
jgi:hypothetical protein